MDEMITKQLVSRNIRSMKEISLTDQDNSAKFNMLLGEIMPCMSGIIWQTLTKFKSLHWEGRDELHSIGTEVFWSAYRGYKIGMGATFITYFITSLNNKYKKMVWKQQGHPLIISNKDKKYMNERKYETHHMKFLNNVIKKNEINFERRLTIGKLVSMNDVKNYENLFSNKENVKKEEQVNMIVEGLVQKLSKEEKELLGKLYEGCQGSRHAQSIAHKYLEDNHTGRNGKGCSHGEATITLQEFLSKLRLLIKDTGVDMEFLFRE